MGIGATIAEITAAISTAFASAGAWTAGTLGLEAATGAAIGTGLEGAAIGGLAGGGLSAIEGKPILPGLIEGGLTGGAIGGVGPALGGALGIGTTAGEVLAGAGAGALGGAITGQDPGMGALGGAAGGLAAGLSGVGATPEGAVPGSGAAAAGGGAGAPVAPTLGGGGVAATDLTSAGSAFGNVTSDAAGAASYGPTSAFSTDIGTSAGALGMPGPAGNDLIMGAVTSTPDAAGTAPLPMTSVSPGAPPDPTGSAFGNVTSDAASPATYGPTSTFNTGSPTWLQQAKNFLSPVGDAVDSVGSLVGSPTGKAASTALSLGMLGKDLMTPSTVPGQAQLASLVGTLGSTTQSAQDQVKQAQGQSAVLESYLTNGTLPAPLQASLSQATDSAITHIKSSYAARGMPPGSSAEVADIAALQQNAVVQGGSLAASLYQQGYSQQQIAQAITGNLLSSATSATGVLINEANAQNNALSSAIANVATSLGGGNKIVLNTGTAAAA